MGKYFSIEELCRSNTAEQRGIDNTPDYFATGNLELLIKALDGIREAWGSGIRVTSGYRSEALNRAVGGSRTSSHMSGLAADLVPSNGDLEGFKRFIVDYLTRNGIDFDQCILERSGRTEWVHFSPMKSNGEQRKMIFKIED